MDGGVTKRWEGMGGLGVTWELSAERGGFGGRVWFELGLKVGCLGGVQ